MPIRKSLPLQRIALRTAAIYLVVAGLWIITSDRIVSTIWSDPATIANLSTAKGWGFVVLTATLLYSTLRRQLARVDAESEARRQAVAEVIDQRRRLDGIIEGTRVGTWEWNVQTGETVFNERWAEILGYTLAELAPISIQTWERLVHPEDGKASEALLKRHFAGELASYDIECRMRHKDGHWVWVHDRGRVIDRTADGSPLMMFGTHTDISERKAAELALRASEIRLRLFIEHAPAALAVFDRDMRYLAVSRRWVEDYGLQAIEVLGRSHYEIFPDLPERWKEAHRRGLAGDAVQADVDSYQRDDGNNMWIRWEVRPWRDHDGSVGGIAIITEDISQRIAAMRALKLSEERFRAVVESSPEAIFVQVRGCFAYANAAASRLFGFERVESMIGRPVLESIHPASRDAAAARIKALNEQRLEQATMEHRILRADGSVAFAQVLGVPFDFDEQHGALVFGRDVTTERNATDQLRLHEAILRDTGEIAKVGGWTLDAATKAVYWTDEVARIHDLEPGDAPSVEIGLGFFQRDSRRQLEAAIQAAVGNGTPYDLQLELISAKGRHKWVRTIGHPIVENGKVVRLRGSFQDVTELHEATEALRESETRFRQIAETINEVFWLYDEVSKKLIYASPAYDVIWGRSTTDLLNGGHRWLDTIHAEDRRRMEEASQMQAGSGAFDETYRIIRPDGKIRWIHDRAFALRDPNGQIVRTVGTAEDITDRRRLEEQIRHSQKMEAIGTLAGGIAHDFNNLLGAIMGFAELARFQVQDRPDARENLDDILRAGKRAVGLVRQILAFSRRASSERLVMSLRPIVEEACRLLRATIPASIQMKLELDGRAPGILGDPNQIHQVVMNLGANAWHAMRDHVGVLEIKLSACTIGLAEAAAASEFAVKEGEYVLLTVRDTGVGMSQEVRERIFEPFFTTKKPGEGTGLGLSVVHGIVRDHGGFIMVDSALGRGTTFSVYFPVATDSLEAKPIERTATVSGGHQRILFVDDEESLVRLGAGMLRQLGFEPEGVVGAAEALALLRDKPDRCDLLITDQSMPAMTGVELAKKVRMLRPGLPILLVTGHASEPTEAALADGLVNRLLIKPLSLIALAEALGSLLAKPRGNHDRAENPAH